MPLLLVAIPLLLVCFLMYSYVNIVTETQVLHDVKSLCASAGC